MPAWEVPAFSAPKMMTAIKRLFPHIILGMSIISTVLILPLDVSAQKVEDNSWKNFYGIAWTGGADEGIQYANQVGYEYIALNAGLWGKNRYASNPNRAGLKFYLIDPEWLQDMIPVIGSPIIDTTLTYTQDKIDYFNKYFIWKGQNPFPNNLATRWFFTPTTFRPAWDSQQQAVIDYLIIEIVNLIKSYENQSIGFTFAGWMLDSPALSGHFTYWDTSQNKNIYVTLPYWTGSDSGFLHDNITHEYSSYTEANANFYKQLNAALQQAWPDRKWITEPYRLYAPYGGVGEWVWQIKDRSDKEEIKSDLILQESSSTEFVDDVRIFNAGVNITKDMVGITQPNSVEEFNNRLYAAKAGINGAWYDWFGRFGGTGNMPKFTTISAVYPRLKLIRLIPNWDNLNNIPLTSQKLGRQCLPKPNQQR